MRKRRGKRSKMPALIWGVIYPVLLYFVMAVVFQVAAILIFPALADDSNTMWLLTVTDGLMIPVFLWLYIRNDRKKRSFTGGIYWYDVPARREVGRPSVYVWAVVGGIVLSRVLNVLIYLTPLPNWFGGYSEVSDALYSCSLLSQVCASVIAAPIMEELLMRGLVYGKLRDGLTNKKAAVLLGALAFGVFHGNVVQGLYAFLMGLFFIRIYDEGGSLLAPILAHMAANGSSILLQWFFG